MHTTCSVYYRIDNLSSLSHIRVYKHIEHTLVNVCWSLHCTCGQFVLNFHVRQHHTRLSSVHMTLKHHVMRLRHCVTLRQGIELLYILASSNLASWHNDTSIHTLHILRPCLTSLGWPPLSVGIFT